MLIKRSRLAKQKIRLWSRQEQKRCFSACSWSSSR